MNPSNHSWFTYLAIFHSVSSILRFPSNLHRAKTYANLYPIIDQLFKKIHPSCERKRERMRRKRSDWDLSRIAALQQHRYNTRHSSLEEEGRASMHEALLRGAHRYTHVPCFSAYTSLPSIVAPRPRWICRSVPPSLFLLFFLFQTFATSKSAVRFFPCFRDNSNFFLKNLTVFCHLRYNCVDGGKRKRESYPIFREKFVEKF